MKIYYVLPDLFTRDLSILNLLRSILKGNFFSHLKNKVIVIEKPIGGVKVIYQHVQMLRDLGYDASLISMGKYKGNYFNYNLEPLPYAQVISKIKEEDVIVIPEMYFGDSKFFSVGYKVLFAQNWCYLYNYHPFIKILESGSYKDSSFDYVISVSDYITSKLDREPDGVVHKISNFIDHDIFSSKPELRIENRIMVMPRKNKKDILSIMSRLKDFEGLNYTVFFADGLKEIDLINEYRKSDIYLATGYPEGFALPPIEAMACGCAVVGFTGGGANEFMIDNETALVVDDGDTENAALKLQSILKDKSLKERIRENGIKKAKEYNKEKSASELLSFYGCFR